MNRLENNKLTTTPLDNQDHGEQKFDKSHMYADNSNEDEDDEDEDEYESADYFHVSSSDSEDEDFMLTFRSAMLRDAPEIKPIDVAWTVWRPQLSDVKHSGFFWGCPFFVE